MLVVPYNKKRVSTNNRSERFVPNGYYSLLISNYSFEMNHFVNKNPVFMPV